MGSKRRRLLELMATAGAVSIAGCTGDGDTSDGDDESGGDSGDTGGNDDGNSTDGNNRNSEDTDYSGETDGEDSTAGDDGSTDDDSDGDSEDGGSDTDEQIQPSEVTGTAQSNVAGLEVVSHEVTGVDPQVRIELELRNAGGENNIALTHHSIESSLFDADGNDILREQSGTQGPESSPPPGESRVVTIYILPEAGAEPSSYEITVNCDGVEYDGFTYCSSG